MAAIIEVGTIVRTFDAFGQAAGKHQTGGTVAIPTVGLRQTFEQINHIGFGHALKAGLNPMAVLPG